MPYKRPDIDALQKEGGSVADTIKNADSAEEVRLAYLGFEKRTAEFLSMASIAYIRHSVDTKDEFYDSENTFMDEAAPLLAQISQEISLAVLGSPYREELKKTFGELFFKKLEIEVRSFKGEMIALMQKENKLASDYQKLYASATVEWEGEKIPLPKLGPYKQSPDRETRKKAYFKEGEFFDAHRAELDEIYSALVKNRNEQARLLGHKNYIPLGYDRLGRNCYGYDEIKDFRSQIEREIVPVVTAAKKAQSKRLEIEEITVYDDALLFPDGNAKPKGNEDDILAAGRSMYRELSPESAEFIEFMFENRLFDVKSREGKAPGGYCTSIPLYKAPFIFSNFNGTLADVDVLTHEAGHAFAYYRAMQKNDCILAMKEPTIEACEVHSMSMEFLTGPWHVNFFGEQTAKYELGHCMESLNFIPYGTMVDEFQHIMYENEGFTPEERNNTWLELEKKYRPYLRTEGVPFYGRGAGWQKQLHIYLYPLYYIDYCLAQTVAYQFWIESMKDRNAAWKKYLAFVDLAGTRTFDEMVKSAGLRVPYEEGCIRDIGSAIGKWIMENSAGLTGKSL